MNKQTQSKMNSYSNLINVDNLKQNHRKPTKSVRQTASTNNVMESGIKTKSWQINSYNISSTYTPTDSIYLNIISNKTFVNYDGFVREADLESGSDSDSTNMSLDKFYILMVNCFDQAELSERSEQSEQSELSTQSDKSAQLDKSINKNNTYSLEWDYRPSGLSVEFFAVLDGFFEISAKISLEEKILSSDKVLSITLNEIQSKHQEEISRLENRISELENQPIVFASHPSQFGVVFSLSPLARTLDLTKSYGFESHGNYLDFNKLKVLNEIVMFNSQFQYRRGLIDYKLNDKLCDHSQNTGQISHSSYCVNCLPNLFDSPKVYLPTVTIMTICFKDTSQIPSALRSLPNIQHLIFDKFGNTQLSPFELIKSFGKLRKIVFNNCLSISNLDQIKNWSDSKNIKLEIK